MGLNTQRVFLDVHKMKKQTVKKWRRIDKFYVQLCEVRDELERGGGEVITSMEGCLPSHCEIPKG